VFKVGDRVVIKCMNADTLALNERTGVVVPNTTDIYIKVAVSNLDGLTDTLIKLHDTENGFLFTEKELELT
jgi:hypothetical protein